MIDLEAPPLEEDAIARIVDDVRKAPRDRGRLVEMLAQARAEYVCRCLSDRDHTPKKQHSELEALYKAARRFREALCHYGDQGWPGWPIVESSAEVERERLVKERKRLEAPLLKWRLRERRLRKQKMTI